MQSIPASYLRVNRYTGLFLISLMFSQLSSPVWAARAGSAWGEKYFPNLELVTQDGEKVRFYDDLIKDKVFAISFIYTRCTDSCPLETAALRKLQKALGDKMGKDVVFYSISIDGDRDKPEELKEYAKKFNVGPGWTFLTGRPEDVKLLRQKMGLYRNDGQNEALNEHGISILMGNERAGQWIKRSPFEETEALVKVLGTRLQSHATTQLASQVPVDRKIATSHGEAIFNTRCEACHSLGSEAGVGPGLAGVVAKRDPNWLKQWIKEPDRLIAANDPTAVALYQQYQNLPMPNLRLSDVDVDSVLQYLSEHEKAQVAGGTDAVQ